MTQVKLTEKGKSILFALAEKKYKSAVPDEDIKDFLILQGMGFVSAVVASDKETTSYLAPQITARGLAYMAEYPILDNPRKHIDWKWIVGTLIALAAVVIAILELIKK